MIEEMDLEPIEGEKKEMPVTHRLKTWPEYFEAMWKGEMPWNVRLNDRNYRVGDVSIFEEWNPITTKNTGRLIEGVILYVAPRIPEIDVMRSNHVAFTYLETARFPVEGFPAMPWLPGQEPEPEKTVEEQLFPHGDHVIDQGEKEKDKPKDKGGKGKGKPAAPGG